MATRKQFNKVVITGCPIIPRGTNTQGGTVIGDYVHEGNRYIVVEMPKVEKKAPKKQKKGGPVTQQVADAVKRQSGQVAQVPSDAPSLAEV